MTTVMSSSPAASPTPTSPPANSSQLHGLITSPTPQPRTNLQRPLSHASRSRLSQYSLMSERPARSRPTSHMFTDFLASFTPPIIRDFAYAVTDPLHYGPPPEPSNSTSGTSTPYSDQQRRLSDPPTSWDSRGWDPAPGRSNWSNGEQLAPIKFGDGPPWSEDEDLQSPVVISSRHKKHKSSGAGRGRGKSREDNVGQRRSQLLSGGFDAGRGYYAGTNGDGSERYYVGQGGEANGPGGEIVTHPPNQARRSLMAGDGERRRDSHFAGGLLPRGSYSDGDNVQNQPYETDSDDDTSRSSSPSRDESRYSKNYQFSIASPDEEMHGKAVALFDFERENENELPLVEGQIIWVSYRHGQGWLVAEDPKTRESGLVPEEYVRLLRDIQGGLSSLTGTLDGDCNDTGTPTQADHGGFGHNSTTSNSSNFSASGRENGYQQPVISTFSTSSQDLHPYPLQDKAHGEKPKVEHYHGQRGGSHGGSHGGSQAGTPTLGNGEKNARGELLRNVAAEGGRKENEKVGSD